MRADTVRRSGLAIKIHDEQTGEVTATPRRQFISSLTQQKVSSLLATACRVHIYLPKKMLIVMRINFLTAKS